jgi:FkbM family methyltransferase
VKGKAFQVAMLDTEKEIDFTYYPQVSIVSGINEDVSEVKEVVRSYIENSEKGKLLSEEIDSLLEVKLESKRIKVKTKTLSQIIEEEKIENIDLLKIDVENSEHLVINGIKDKDWKKIDSIIIEIHDVDGRLNMIKETLEQKGFQTHVEKEEMLSKDDILYNLFAIREGVKNGVDTLGEKDKLRLSQWNSPADLINKIKTETEKKLPGYMIPNHFILLNQFPLTRNGKLDKKALPDPDLTYELSSQYAAPRNELEKKLAEIWKELLEVEKVGIHDNFFELGGHSLLVMQVISSIRKQLEVELSINDFFKYPVLEDLSEFIKDQIKEDVISF